MSLEEIIVPLVIAFITMAGGAYVTTVIKFAATKDQELTTFKSHSVSVIKAAYLLWCLIGTGLVLIYLGAELFQDGPVTKELLLKSIALVLTLCILLCGLLFSFFLYWLGKMVDWQEKMVDVLITLNDSTSKLAESDKKLLNALVSVSDEKHGEKPEA